MPPKVTNDTLVKGVAESTVTVSIGTQGRSNVSCVAMPVTLIYFSM